MSQFSLGLFHLFGVILANLLVLQLLGDVSGSFLLEVTGLRFVSGDQVTVLVDLLHQTILLRLLVHVLPLWATLQLSLLPTLCETYREQS